MRLFFLMLATSCVCLLQKMFFFSVIFSLYDFTLGTAIGSSCFVGFPMKILLLRYILLKVWKLKCAAKRTQKNELSLKSLQKKSLLWCNHVKRHRSPPINMTKYFFNSKNWKSTLLNAKTWNSIWGLPCLLRLR